MSPVDDVVELTRARTELLAGKDGVHSFTDAIKAIDAAIARAASAAYPVTIVEAV